MSDRNENLGAISSNEGNSLLPKGWAKARDVIIYRLGTVKLPASAIPTPSG